MTWRSNQFQQFDAETFLAKELKNRGMGVFIGATDPNVRKARFKNAIIAANLECTVIGTDLKGKNETFLEFYERIYQEPFGKTYT